MTGYAALMRRLGANPLQLLEKYGLPPDLGAHEEALVPLAPIVAMMEESAVVTGRPDFGLQLAASQDIRILGPLAAAMQHSSTVGEAVETASRYLFVQSPALVLSTVEPSSFVADAVELRLDLVVPEVPVRRQSMDQCLGDLHRILQFLVRDQYRLLGVTLPHAPVGDLGVYKRFFGAPVHPEQEYGGVHVSPETLSASLAAVNKSLREMALDYLNRHYMDPGQSMAARVRRALNTTLSSTRGSKSVIADLLFLHPRTLQRKLAAEGAKFEDIRDAVRRETALHYLRETRIPLSQLSSLLGLSDQSVLTRSCLRWFGQTPSSLRSNSATGVRTG